MSAPIVVANTRHCHYHHRHRRLRQGEVDFGVDASFDGNVDTSRYALAKVPIVIVVIRLFGYGMLLLSWYQCYSFLMLFLLLYWQ